MSKHTAAPWLSKPSIHGSEYRYVQIGADVSYTTLEVLPEDANLIATSPDMFAALKAIIRDPHGCRFCDSGKLRDPAKTHDNDCGFFLATAAIEKAAP